MRTRTRALASAGALCLALAPWAQAQELPLVFVEQSESLVEMQIDDYLRKTERFAISIEEWNGIPDDLYLVFDRPSGNAPSLTFQIDTLQSATGVNNVVTERVIRITSWYVINVTPDHWAREPILELINGYAQELWSPPKIYLDSDGDIRLEWYINIAGEDAPVHLEQVRDAINRIGDGWEQNVYPRLVNLGIE